jgi:hypothetical protein
VVFDHEAALKSNFPIVSAITAVELPYRTSVVLIVHEGNCNDNSKLLKVTLMLMSYSLTVKFILLGY